MKVRIGGDLWADVQRALPGNTCAAHPRCEIPAAYAVAYLGLDDTHRVLMCDLHMPVGLKPPQAAKENA